MLYFSSHRTIFRNTCWKFCSSWTIALDRFIQTSFLFKSLSTCVSCTNRLCWFDCCFPFRHLFVAFCLSFNFFAYFSSRQQLWPSKSLNTYTHACRPSLCLQNAWPQMEPIKETHIFQLQNDSRLTFWITISCCLITSSLHCYSIVLGAAVIVCDDEMNKQTDMGSAMGCLSAPMAKKTRIVLPLQEEREWSQKS